MRQIITVLQIIVGFVLVLFVLIQVKGTGFGRVWGGSPSFTRRGLEKLVFKLTFVISAIFVLLSLVTLVI